MRGEERLKQRGEAMTHSSSRNPKVKAIAEVLAMIADAHPRALDTQVNPYPAVAK